MMGKVFVFLADGFEEIEGLTVVDMLRRAEIPTVTVSIGSSRNIIGEKFPRKQPLTGFKRRSN